MKRLAFLPFLLTSVSAFAASPVGSWTGKFQVQLPVLPPNLTPAQKAMAASAMQQIKTGRIYLVVKADHTYTTRTVNLPSLGAPASRGTWTQKGGVVTLKETKAGTHPQDFSLSADGKAMSFPMPGGHGSLSFTR